MSEAIEELKKAVKSLHKAVNLLKEEEQADEEDGVVEE